MLFFAVFCGVCCIIYGLLLSLIHIFPYLKGENSVEITYADGKSEKITYAKTGSAVIKIPCEDIDKTSFTSVSGTSVLTAFGNARCV